MTDFAHVVLPNGELNDDLIEQKEEISNQKNVGRPSLFRFWMKAKQGELKSYIFKPSKDKAPVDFEIWFQKQIKPRLINVRVPELLACSNNDRQGNYWMIFEDAGQVESSFDRDIRIRAVQKMTEWHSLPIDSVPSEFKSFMPYIDDAMSELLQRKEHYSQLLTDIGVPGNEISNVFRLLAAMDGVFPSEKVVCHGDYHCLNLMNVENDLIVLDWEFIQVNAVYWDFYTLLDMATPRYRIQIDKDVRIEALNAYFEERKASIPVSFAAFSHGYHLYALIYSIGVLGLIEGDLTNNRFDRETLLVQKKEVTNIIRDCLDAIAPSP